MYLRQIERNKFVQRLSLSDLSATKNAWRLVQFCISFIAILLLAAASAHAACRTAGNNIFCDSCADARNSQPFVLLSPNVTPNGTQGSNNSFCRISNLAPGESLSLRVEDLASTGIASFEVDYNRVGAMPASLIPSSVQNVNVILPVPGFDTRTFVHSEAGPADTTVRANIADTQPAGNQQPNVSAKVTCSCQAPTNVTTLTILKTVDGADKKFTFDGPSPFNTFSLANGETASYAAPALTPGNLVISETKDANYDLQSATCSGNATGETLTETATAYELTVPVANGENVFCEFINKERQDPLLGKLTIRKTVSGTDKIFAFNGTGPFGAFLLSNGQSQVQGNLTPGNFVITETLDPDYKLNSVSCTGNAVAETVNSNQLTVPVGAGEDVTCTFANGIDDPRMEEETERFVKRRVDNLLSHGPDRARLLRRLRERPAEKSLKDSEPLKFARSGRASTVATPGGLSRFAYQSVPGRTDGTLEAGHSSGGSSNPFFDTILGHASKLATNQNSFKFGTSLSALRSQAAQHEAKQRQAKVKAAGLSFSGATSDAHYDKQTGLDIWIEGQYSRYNDDVGGVNREGHFKVFYVGADYLMAPGLLVGFLGQVDHTSEDIQQVGETGEIDGTGWMVGPYVGVHLFKNLFFDARAAWGQSDNDIWLQDNVLGYREGSFTTDRWLATATLTGSEHFGRWRISPQIGIAYGHEKFGTYQNSAGLIVQGGEASIGRATGKLEIGYRMQTSDGTRIEPHASIEGIWNFASDDLVINGAVVNSAESRAKVEGGVLVVTPDGWSFRAAGHYDGIGGDDFHAYGGSLWVNVPLN